ncbi:hypothetical protein [Alicyclobacillus macrosporangiidus]|uniref:hypothetical protein n=1 Tax=Alicyclobacillus macrosporangiidus TaxID=392015 RepID=UPI0004968479|nr:hypothetical protein [Alicyclobacillus macrosporangiidus]
MPMGRWRAWGAALAVAFSLLMMLKNASAAESLRVAQMQLFLIPAPVAHTVRVMEAFDLRTDGRSVNAHFTLPEQASEVSVQTPGGLRAQTKGSAVGVTGTAPSDGSFQVTVTYHLPMPGMAQSIRWHADYPVDQALVYVPEGEVSLSAEGVLTGTRTVDISGTTFRVFTRLGVPADTDWPLQVQVMPAPTTGSDTGGLPVIGLDHSQRANAMQALANLALAAFVLAVGLASIRRSTRGGPPARPQDEEAAWTAWVQLERAYENGDVDTASYERRRAALKRRIVALRTQAPGGRE